MLIHLGLSLSRQNLPVLDRAESASAEGVARGGYVLAEASGGTPEVILMGTGSELQIAVAARQALEAEGVPTRVVSLPCWEWFATQVRAYREQVLPPTVRARVSVEAGVPMGWREFVGDVGRMVGLNHFGASAAYTMLYEQFGLAADAVVVAARESLAAVEAPPVAPAFGRVIAPDRVAGTSPCPSGRMSSQAPSLASTSLPAACRGCAWCPLGSLRRGRHGPPAGGRPVCCRGCRSPKARR